MKTIAVMLKDLRLILRDRFGFIALLVVPIVVIVVVASATQSGDGSNSVLFPIVNQGQGPFSSVEQNIAGFSLMFVLLTLIFSVSLGMREEEVWGTSGRLSVAPVPPASLLGGKLLARLIVGTAQLLLLLLFGHFVYGLRLGHSPIAIVLVATAVVASMTFFACLVASFVRTREQAIPICLAVAFVLALLA